MFFSAIYEMVCWCFALLALPKLVYSLFVRKKYRQSILKRLGIDYPMIKKGDRPLVWIHAVSVGETKAVAALAKLIKDRLDDPVLVVSSVTETGHAEAQRSICNADYHLYLPYDFHWIVKPLMRRVRPDLVLLSETDFWFQFLRQAKKVGAFVALVNGKLSERSLSRFRWFPSFTNRLFGWIDSLCVQNEIYRQRFECLGVPKDKIAITGNLKFDDEYPTIPNQDLMVWKSQLGIPVDDPVLVIGSTHDPEERELIDVFNKVWERVPDLKVVIAPRHPERFEEVAGLFTAAKIPFARLSQLNKRPKNIRIVLIDTMGLLRQCYQLADVAIVGGSFTDRVGGHNILEPCWYGVPVLFGPYMYSQPELLELVNQARAGLQVSTDLLPDALISFYQDVDRRQEIGQAGLQLVNSIRGATEKTWDTIRANLYFSPPLGKRETDCLGEIGQNSTKESRTKGLPRTVVVKK